MNMLFSDCIIGCQRSIASNLTPISIYLEITLIQEAAW